MDLAQAIAGRRSVRDFTAQPISQQAIERLIDAAVHAPSAVNQQPWRFTVVRDQTVLDRLSRDAKSHALATMADDPQVDRFRAMLNDAGFHIFYHAPVLVLISAVEAGPWIVEDCALAAENLMLAAHAAGLGTCWIGFAQGSLNTAEGKHLLGLPPSCVPVAPIIVGHPTTAPPPVLRNAPDIRWIG
ncbi:MAG TPA: nitroreductase [Rhodopila sp.]|nr:nitroreductase [Rhodopila sp.]